VLPLPASWLVVIKGLDDMAAVRALSQALGSLFESRVAAHWPGQGNSQDRGFAGFGCLFGAGNCARWLAAR